MTECAATIFQTAEIEHSISPDKTVFHHLSNLTEFQEVGKVSYNLCKRFKGEHINNVLGL